MKAQSPAISHIIIISFGVMVLISVTASMNYLREDYRNFVVQNEMERVCLILKNSALKIYSESNNDFLSGKIKIELPKKIADLNYRIKNNFFIYTTSQNYTYNCSLGLNVNFIGGTSGGKTELSYYTNPERFLIGEYV